MAAHATPNQRQPDLGQLVDEDLREIVKSALDLAYYRRMSLGAELSRATARELQLRVAQLPEHDRD